MNINILQPFTTIPAWNSSAAGSLMGVLLVVLFLGLVLGVSFAANGDSRRAIALRLLVPVGCLLVLISSLVVVAAGFRDLDNRFDQARHSLQAQAKTVYGIDLSDTAAADLIPHDLFHYASYYTHPLDGTALGSTKMIEGNGRIVDVTLYDINGKLGLYTAAQLKELPHAK